MTPLISNRDGSESDRYARILRWTYGRGGEDLYCELGLTLDLSAYELRLAPPAKRDSATAELFDDPLSAFERLGAIERTLLDEGWSLESFETQQMAAVSQPVVRVDTGCEAARNQPPSHGDTEALDAAPQSGGAGIRIVG